MSFRITVGIYTFVAEGYCLISPINGQKSLFKVTMVSPVQTGFVKSHSESVKVIHSHCFSEICLL